MCCLSAFLSLQAGIARFLDYLRSPLLLLFRLYWGWQFFETGRGKLANISDVVGFFTSLGIPLPVFTAHLVGTTELIGGALLILGLASRLVSIPLTVTMIVAYLTADWPAVTGILSDPDTFVKAAPFPFLVTSLIVLAFGPGIFSLDHLIGKFQRGNSGACCNQNGKGNV